MKLINVARSGSSFRTFTRQIGWLAFSYSSHPGSGATRDQRSSAPKPKRRRSREGACTGASSLSLPLGSRS